jgi:adenylate cyclase
VAFRPTDNVEAYDDMLRAVEALWRPDGTKNNNAEARNWVEKAIELDPKFAEAYAFLGWTYCNDAVNLWSQSRKVDLERASEFALKALALDDSNGDALALLARYDLMQRLFDQAVAAGERAIAINPNYAMSYMALSEALNASGKPEAGIRAAEKGMRLDPSSEDFYAAWTGCAYTIMGRYEEAISPFRRHLAVYPNNIVARFYLCCGL